MRRERKEKEERKQGTGTARVQEAGFRVQVLPREDVIPA
jgi:hypothetical protein